jgi:hypothetical protein
MLFRRRHLPLFGQSLPVELDRAEMTGCNYAAGRIGFSCRLGLFGFGRVERVIAARGWTDTTHCRLIVFSRIYGHGRMMLFGHALRTGSKKSMPSVCLISPHLI